MASTLKLAAASVALFAAAASALDYEGCVALDSADFARTETFLVNSPDACWGYCELRGYPWAAVSGQTCACAAAEPDITRTYANVDNEDCYIRCGLALDEYCGGVDNTTSTPIYGLYYQPVQDFTSSTSSAPSFLSDALSTTSFIAGAPTISSVGIELSASTSIAGAAEPSATEAAGAEAAGETGFPFPFPHHPPFTPPPFPGALDIPATSSSVLADPVPTTLSTSCYPDHLPSYTVTIYSTAISIFSTCPICPGMHTTLTVPVGTTCIPPALFTSHIHHTHVHTCPDGALTTETSTECSTIPYNPYESTVSTSCDETATHSFLVPVNTPKPTPPASCQFGNCTYETGGGHGGGHGGSISKPAPTHPIVTAGAAALKEEGSATALIVLGAFIFGGILLL
ncbi:hypothetical protein NKR23_g5388 [Pleurostoma richardsiae]|uniref:WSC domain-containing protein n=1 Tax=Pleurostoma richardsiae TaxID=41990 RepID=A0AA38S297_9PEZI|nr:hypothetical protein NKR23_g5388 [Pleurostoma richardsiae]